MKQVKMLLGQQTCPLAAGIHSIGHLSLTWGSSCLLGLSLRNEISEEWTMKIGGVASHLQLLEMKRIITSLVGTVSETHT